MSLLQDLENFGLSKAAIEARSSPKKQQPDKPTASPKKSASAMSSPSTSKPLKLSRFEMQEVGFYDFFRLFKHLRGLEFQCSVKLRL